MTYDNQINGLRMIEEEGFRLSVQAEFTRPARVLMYSCSSADPTLNPDNEESGPTEHPYGSFLFQPRVILIVVTTYVDNLASSRSQQHKQ